MGVTSFIKVLEQRFVDDAKRQPRPDVIDGCDVDSLRTYLWEGFALWFLQNRDELLAEEWAQLGWVNLATADNSGQPESGYQVREDSLQLIEAWLNDEPTRSPAPPSP